MSQDLQEFKLSRQNLIPFYLIEDRIKENFSKIQKFISRQLAKNKEFQEEDKASKEYNKKYKQEVDKKFIDLQKKIVKDINAGLQGQIIVAINKNMSSFRSKIEEKSKQIEMISQGINEKLQGLKKTIVFQVNKDNQKYFSKEAEKLQKKLKANLQIPAKTNTKPVNINVRRPQSREKDSKKQNSKMQKQSKTSNYQIEGAQPHFSVIHEEMTIKFKEIQDKMNKFEQFSANVDKRFYDNMTSLKQSWKQLGEEVLQTKKKLTLRQDDLKLELIKIKSIKQFQGAPQDFEETFKNKLMAKFVQLYQLIGSLVTKNDLDSVYESTKKIMNRHDNQLNDVRQQMAKNSDYFTFYANNSNEDDLSGQIKLIHEQIQSKQIKTNQKISKMLQHHESLKTQIFALNQNIKKHSVKNSKMQNDLAKIREELFRQIDRIDVLEDTNKLSPQKMAKIHNTLDIDFTPSEQQLITKKNHNESHNNALKEMKGQINKLKDQLFVLNHEISEIEKVKKNINGLEGKISKLKFQSQEAMISRKPWVCLSCDKNQKQKHDHDKLKKDSSKKKLSDNKNLFTKEAKNDKMIKLLPSTDQKFQIYQKYREKYLSDSVRLPEIYRQKIGEKQP